MLKSGQQEEEKEMEKKEQPEDKKTSAATQDVKVEPAKPEAEFADVLRWDDDELRWVRDVLEIVEIKPRFPEDPSGRVKLSQEVGDKLGNALKNMIGGAKPPMVKKRAITAPEPSSPAGRASTRATPSASPGSLGSSLCEALGMGLDSPTQHAKWADVQDDGHPKISPTSRRSRRGAQPTGSEVTQVNGFMMNPQAKEFYPVTGSPVSPSKVHALNLQAFLNPEAEQFSPQPAAAEFRKPLGTVPPFPVEASTATSVPLAGAAEPAQPSSSSSSSYGKSSSDKVEADIPQKVAAADGQVEADIPEKISACVDESDWSIGKALFSAFSMFGLGAKHSTK